MKLDTSDSGRGYIVFSFYNILWLMNLKYMVTSQKPPQVCLCQYRFDLKTSYILKVKINKEKKVYQYVLVTFLWWLWYNTHRQLKRRIYFILNSFRGFWRWSLGPFHKQDIMEVERKLTCWTGSRERRRARATRIPGTHPQWLTYFLQRPHLLFVITS